jgi:hypothetical protein
MIREHVTVRARIVRPEIGVVGGYLLKTRADLETFIRRITIFHLHYCTLSYTHCLSISYASQECSFN